MFRLAICCMVVSFIFISTKCESSAQTHPTEFVYDNLEKSQSIELDNGEYIEKLIVQMSDCDLEKKMDYSESRRMQLEKLYAGTLIARGLHSWVPQHLKAINDYKKKKCSLEAQK